MFSENTEINKKFLELFTIELIKNSNPKIFLEIKKRVEERLSQVRSGSFEDQTKQKLIQPITFQEFSTQKTQQIPKSLVPRQKTQIRRLTIPEPKLPERFKYLRPIPKPVAIDLGKLNQFLVDPKIRVIECTGAEEPIILNPNTSPSTTSMLLTKEEVDDVIKTFSIMSKIPSEEGVYKVIVGNLSFSAVISESIGSRFIIRKLSALPNQTQQRNIFPQRKVMMRR